MDVTLDLDAFIANIEGTAPEEEESDSKILRCQECGSILEDVEGEYICPECNVQATNILQLEETEMQYTEDGRAIAGQRVLLHEKKRKKDVEYGWAWSTDEAIVYILGLQVKALKRLGLVNDNFCIGIKNMWHDFWVRFIGPHIRDEYREEDFVPISVRKALKLRDIEILYKVQDKVMVPSKQSHDKKKSYKFHSMMGRRFRRMDDYSTGDNTSDAVSVNSDDIQIDAVSLEDTIGPTQNVPTEREAIEAELVNPKTGRKSLTNNCNYKSITILTLNRTLAFIEATARCVEMSTPIFASDIVRACSLRMIPFFGVHKILPDDMKMNPLDKLMFQKNRPPSPTELTMASTALLKKIYHERLPFRLPLPNLTSILQRFLDDMNLPSDIMNYIDDRVNFQSFVKTTTKMEFTEKSTRNNPQFDRLAFAILVIHLKRLFIFDDCEMHKMSELIKNHSETTGQDLFIVSDWYRQMTIKMNLILTHDIYSLHHPMANVKEIQPTQQLHKFIEKSYEDKVEAETRISVNKYPIWDKAFREELAEFLTNQIPRPPHIDKEELMEDELEESNDLLHPIQDAFKRSIKLWSIKAKQDRPFAGIINYDYRNQKIHPFKVDQMWCIYSTEPDYSHAKHNIDPDWPDTFKLLLSIGAYICYCEPKDLLTEYKLVEKYLYGRCKTLRVYQKTASRLIITNRSQSEVNSRMSPEELPAVESTPIR